MHARCTHAHTDTVSHQLMNSPLHSPIQQLQLQRPGQGADESSDAPDQPQEAPTLAQHIPGRAMSETQVAKTLSELDMMRMNIVVLNEMMAEIEPGTQIPGEVDLMSQLNTMLKEAQKRIVTLCERIRDDMLLCKLRSGVAAIMGGWCRVCPCGQ